VNSASCLANASSNACKANFFFSSFSKLAILAAIPATFPSAAAKSLTASLYF